MAEFDVHDIERRICEYDPRIRRIDFNHKRGMHRIIGYDHTVDEEYIVMTVPAGQLDARVERRIMEINPDHFNALEDIDAARVERERREERKVEDMARDFADVFHKPLVRDYTGA